MCRHAEFVDQGNVWNSIFNDYLFVSVDQWR